jgi:fatty acid-binding protein DegV
MGLALRAAGLAESGWRAGAVVEKLTRVTARSGPLLTVDANENLVRSGRVFKGKTWRAGTLEVVERLRFAPAGAYRPRGLRG